MKRFDHKNIVKLLGVCTRGEPVYAVMEFMLHGLFTHCSRISDTCNTYVKGFITNYLTLHFNQLALFSALANIFVLAYSVVQHL